MALRSHKNADGSTSWEARGRDGERFYSRRFNSRVYGSPAKAREAARKWDLERQRQKREGAFGATEPSGMTLRDFIVRWWAERGPEWAEATKRDRADRIERWVDPYIGHVPLRELGRERVFEFRSSIVEAGSPAQNTNKVLSILSAALGHAAGLGLIPYNPVAGMRRIPHKPRRPYVLSAVEVERIRKAMMDRPQEPGVPDTRHRDATIVAVLCYAGLRPSEVWGLRWASVGESTLHIREAFVRGEQKGTKSGRERVVALEPPLAAILEVWRDANPGARGLVFPGTRGGHMPGENWAARIWHPAREAAGVTEYVAPFEGRHTRASLLIHAGHGLAYVADQLGHADVQITARHYVHLIEEARQAGSVPVADAIERAQVEVHGTTTTARPEGLRLVQEDTPR